LFSVLFNLFLNHLPFYYSLGGAALCPFFTRAGDDGTTGLLGKGRVPKNDPVLEALGAVDEATASLGLARSLSKAAGTGEIILQIQRHLYILMSEIAATPENAEKFRVIDASQVAWLEEQTERLGRIAPMSKEFIVPGDTLAGAAFDVARTVVRRAERRVIDLKHRGRVTNPHLFAYLNRLSSLVFALELYENQEEGHSKPTLARGEG
jgi:cob(I)alamin adenosyltransferase